jgi:hypothetical protein
MFSAEGMRFRRKSMVAVMMGELGSRVWSAAARPPIKWGSAQLLRGVLYRSDLLRVRVSASKRFGAGCDVEGLRWTVGGLA